MFVQDIVPVTKNLPSYTLLEKGESPLPADNASILTKGFGQPIYTEGNKALGFWFIFKRKKTSL